MGPYCNFCDRRCFVPLPSDTPEYIKRAYGRSALIATCPMGQEFEKREVGYCYENILLATGRQERTVQTR